MSGTRSRNACHTCRIRKKKCDELRPVCLTCSSRDIPCHGYELAPTWLGAIRGDAEILRSIKHAAETKYKAKRRKWWTDLGDLESRSQISPGGTSAQDLSRWNRDAHDDASTAQMVVWVEQPSLEKHRSSSLSPKDSTALTLQHPRPATRYGESSPPTGSCGNISLTRNSIWWDGGLANNYNVRNTRELGLLMNYLDNVFSLQYGFYQSSASNRNREWLLSSLLRSKPFYNASLGLSAHHQVLVRQGSLNQAMAFSSDRKQLTAWEELSGSELLMTGFEVLGSMNQMLSLEIFRELGGHWGVYLKAARDFLLSIGAGSAESNSSEYAPQRPKRIEVLEKILRDSDGQFFPSSEIAALKFFVLGFIWVDILSCATGLSVFDASAIDYTQLLNDNTLELYKIMGCYNWVMITTLKIADLENRRRTMDRSDILALQDLHDQRMGLEYSLEISIASLLNTRATLASVELDSNLVTEMFALAALTYLHVVISGAYPQLPEIRVIVARALTVLMLLPSRHLLRVSWPFCIIACMALCEQQEMICEAMQKAMTAGLPVGTVWKGLKVAEECWRLREMRDGEAVCWKEAMESLGVRVLLV